MLIITGPGRSGTSVIAQFCQAMGHDPGGDWCAEINAGLENPGVVQINDAILAEVERTGAFTESLALHREAMRQMNLPVVKDPRFTFHPALLHAWHTVRPDIRVLMTYRTPEHCLASRKRHPRFLMHRGKTDAEVFRRDFANTLETLLKLDIPFEMLLFPHFLNQYDKVAHHLQTLGIVFDLEQGRRIWNQLVDESKVHFPLNREWAAKPQEAPDIAVWHTAMEELRTLSLTSRHHLRQQFNVLCHRLHIL